MTDTTQPAAWWGPDTPKWGNIPEYMRDGLMRYVMDGVQPGDFLLALLSNDFMGAASRADDENICAFQDYARFFYNDMPNQAKGSPELVQAWIAHRGFNGMQK